MKLKKLLKIWEKASAPQAGISDVMVLEFGYLFCDRSFKRYEDRDRGVQALQANPSDLGIAHAKRMLVTAYKLTGKEKHQTRGGGRCHMLGRI